MRPFDSTKPAQCRNGNPARILATDAPGAGGPIVALIGSDLLRFYPDGSFFPSGIPSGRDLINIPRKGVVKGFANIYPDGDVRVHETKERAIENATVSILARVPIEIEYTEGAGL